MSYHGTRLPRKPRCQFVILIRRAHTRSTQPVAHPPVVSDPLSIRHSQELLRERLRQLEAEQAELRATAEDWDSWVAEAL